ncbi:hypothetical protein IMCC12053_795 [Celeribacter marinus]|uniref:Uncharacterized protein n=1 Tax=Celeribacter marinus TaxID=1397108 RepID=A0A0P0A339_9RHOB|nr:hypothetical protein IMCC12053_795 [Celeribacter marinus]
MIWSLSIYAHPKNHGGALTRDTSAQRLGRGNIQGIQSTKVKSRHRLTRVFSTKIQ